VEAMLKKFVPKSKDRDHTGDGLGGIAYLKTKAEAESLAP
jgi:hypothetical protein